ncbi:hypothetical protein HMPREF0307_01995 [Corynebacterium sp. DNF00584]|nr:hypothetical protein HMPREF0307_01995 [Corynebacterium sp. DNF00584]
MRTCRVPAASPARRSLPSVHRAGDFLFLQLREFSYELESDTINISDVR